MITYDCASAPIPEKKRETNIEFMKAKIAKMSAKEFAHFLKTISYDIDDVICTDCQIKEINPECYVTNDCPLKTETWPGWEYADD